MIDGVTESLSIWGTETNDNDGIVGWTRLFPRARAVNFWLAGGDLTELTTAMRPCIEVWAKNIGCTHSIIAGRPPAGGPGGAVSRSRPRP